MTPARAVPMLLAAAGLALALSGAVAPGRRSPLTSDVPAGDAVARVNGAPIARDALARAVARLAAGEASRAPEDRGAVGAAPPDAEVALDRLVEEELLVQRAFEMGLVESDRAVRKALARAAIEAALAGANATPASEEELRAFHHDVHAPRAPHLEPLQREPHRHCDVLADDRRTFARQPDLRAVGPGVRVLDVLPVPPKPAGIGGVVAEHPAVEGVDGAGIVEAEAGDVGHDPIAAARGPDRWLAARPRRLRSRCPASAGCGGVREPVGVGTKSFTVSAWEGNKEIRLQFFDADRQCERVRRARRLLRPQSELHLEVLVDRMLREFRVQARVGRPQIADRETLTKPVERAECRYVKQTGGRGQYGHVVLELEPGTPGSGIIFENGITGGVIPKEYIPAIERGVREAAEGGVLAGYPLTDLYVRLYDGSYHEVDSNEMAFRMAGSLAFRDGVKKGNPVLFKNR